MNHLINFLQHHNIAVKHVNAEGTKITVVAQYSKDGVGFSQDEVIDADITSVRNWLGY